MRIEQKIEEIRALIEPVLAAEHVDLVDIELKGTVRSSVLRIFVDVDGGISLDQCTELNRHIGKLLDVHDVIPGRYRLDVSSPGVDRPLRTTRDFQRHIGRTVSLVFTDGSNCDGRIDRVEDGKIQLTINGDERIFPLDSVHHGKIKLQW